MSEINLYPEMNEKIADFLLGCTDNGMLLYAGAYIKDLERQLAEYQSTEKQERNIDHIRKMDPRELAKFIVECCDCSKCPADCISSEECSASIERWLNSTTSTQRGRNEKGENHD